MTRTMSFSTMMNGSVSAINGTTVPERQGNVFDRVWLALKVWQERHDLAALDDRTLQDLGLSRADVEHEIGRSALDLPADRI
jgi:uncharacterized protein YjiS (DUF1127 family)